MSVEVILSCTGLPRVFMTVNPCGILLLFLATMGEDGELMTVSQLIERLESMDKGRQVLLHTGGKDQAPKEVSSVVAGVCLPHGASPGAVLDYDQFHSDVVEVVVLKTED